MVRVSIAIIRYVSRSCYRHYNLAGCHYGNREHIYSWFNADLTKKRSSRVSFLGWFLLRNSISARPSQKMSFPFVLLFDDFPSVVSGTQQRFAAVCRYGRWGLVMAVEPARISSDRDHQWMILFSAISAMVCQSAVHRVEVPWHNTGATSAGDDESAMASIAQRNFSLAGSFFYTHSCWQTV